MCFDRCALSSEDTYLPSLNTLTEPLRGKFIVPLQDHKIICGLKVVLKTSDFSSTLWHGYGTKEAKWIRAIGISTHLTHTHFNIMSNLTLPSILFLDNRPCETNAFGCCYCAN